MGRLLPQTRTSLPWLARSTAASVPGTVTQAGKQVHIVGKM